MLCTSRFTLSFYTYIILYTAVYAFMCVRYYSTYAVRMYVAIRRISSAMMHYYTNKL